jgi:hypothetical protein
LRCSIIEEEKKREGERQKILVVLLTDMDGVGWGTVACVAGLAEMT